MQTSQFIQETWVQANRITEIRSWNIETVFIEKLKMKLRLAMKKLRFSTTFSFIVFFFFTFQEFICGFCKIQHIQMTLLLSFHFPWTYDSKWQNSMTYTTWLFMTVRTLTESSVAESIFKSEGVTNPADTFDRQNKIFISSLTAKNKYIEGNSCARGKDKVTWGRGGGGIADSQHSGRKFVIFWQNICHFPDKHA